jgi:acyl-CoA reductase-like NAD-dependent aldehyde dehydrogenase
MFYKSVKIRQKMETFEVYNPCNGEVVGVCKKANVEDVNQAIEAAHLAFKLWKKTPVAERVKLQHKAAT